MNGQQTKKQRSKIEISRLRLFTVSLSVLVLISCAHQKTYFGIGSVNAGDPLFGYYTCGQFTPVRLAEDYERRMKDISSSNNPKGRVPRALPVGEWEIAQRASSVA